MVSHGRSVPLLLYWTFGSSEMYQAVLSFFALIAALAACFHAYRTHRAWRQKLRELESELAEARHALRRRGDLANEVAHEIKNPITAILCSAEALDLLIGDSLEATHRRSLKYIKEYGDYVLRLISDFLDLSMLESNIKTAHPKHVDVFATVESVLGLLESYAAGRHVSLRHDTANQNLAVYADPKHLRQMIFNAVHNAVKFSKEGGEVRVVCQDTFPGTEARISVKDNGIGMSAEEVKKMFDPYWCNAARKEGGHGLGVPLTKALVDLARGRIEVRSEPGVGTCFDIYLPGSSSKDADDGDLNLDDAERIKPLLGYSFLVVDNDDGARESAASLIEAWGGLVDNVSAAAEAVRILTQKDYDAVVLDASSEETPDDSITEVAQGNTHIILTSRRPLKSELLDALHARRVLEKPFNGKVLLRSLLESTRGILKH